jgi:hypothetical protein
MVHLVHLDQVDLMVRRVLLDHPELQVIEELFGLKVLVHLVLLQVLKMVIYI